MKQTPSSLNIRPQVHPVIRHQEANDTARIDELMKATFGGVRTDRSVWNLRLDSALDDLCFVAELDRKVVGSLRFWQIRVAGQPQLLLGPLAVDPVWQGCGVGVALVTKGLDRARQLRQWQQVFVSGDPDYYPRFGFKAVPANALIWPGPIEQERLQIISLTQNQNMKLPPGPLALLPELPVSA
jgi:predicted N-acetyltransferase YhbS